MYILQFVSFRLHHNFLQWSWWTSPDWPWHNYLFWKQRWSGLRSQASVSPSSPPWSLKIPVPITRLLVLIRDVCLRRARTKTWTIDDGEKDGNGNLKGQGGRGRPRPVEPWCWLGRYCKWIYVLEQYGYGALVDQLLVAMLNCSTWIFFDCQSPTAITRLFTFPSVVWVCGHAESGWVSKSKPL